VLNLALEACQNALNDAGLPAHEVTSIVTYGLNDSIHPQAVATALGLPRLGHYANFFGGGQVCCATLATAEMLIASGRARYVLVFRALNGRSGHRLGGTGMEEMFARGENEAQYTYPFGWLSYPQYIAMAARRHMLKYGTDEGAFAEVAVASREAASLNNRAMKRDPMTYEDHHASRVIADPLRLYDICLETDGACALLVTSKDDARALNRPVVEILAVEQGGGSRPGYAFDGMFTTDDLADLYGEYVADQLYGRAGVEPADVDVASIYDCFTFSVLSQLEGFRFCAPGESGEFVKEGRIRLDGELPVNTNGGMLSEAYIHGMNGIAEVVSQLRGDAGERQVQGATVGLATGFGVTTGCGALLARV
jgi:acetyl-CoA acetyltransferase